MLVYEFMANEAILDTAAEECIIGSQAFQTVTEELATFGLRPIMVRKSAQPCAGIGGQDVHRRPAWDHSLHHCGGTHICSERHIYYQLQTDYSKNT